MGMYDSLEVPEGVRCPKCGGELFRFQTKAFNEPSLMIFRIGDEVSNVEFDDLFIRDGYASCYSSCVTCRASIDGRAYIRENHYVGLDIVAVTEQAEA